VQDEGGGLTFSQAELKRVGVDERPTKVSRKQSLGEISEAEREREKILLDIDMSSCYTYIGEV